MVGTLLVIYVIGLLPVSCAAIAAGKRFADRQAPPDLPTTVMLSLVAGAVWPLLVVGLVELSTIMMFFKAPSKASGGVGIFA
jgi:hypothetical protein